MAGRRPKATVPGDGRFPVVGMGSSAGGLEALKTFLENTPPASGMAFVVVTHLDPQHKSILPELLQKYTSMPVSHIDDGMRVEPNRVYVLPPNRDVAIIDGTLQLSEPVIRQGVRHPIDHFFRSLAQDMSERSICVILSGTGTEGTLGLREIKGAGGLVIVQDPASAAFEGMPRSAISTGIVDLVLPPGEIPGRLADFVGHHHGLIPVKPLSTKPAGKEDLRRILLIIRDATGNDFSKYKKTTLLRRIERRMSMHKIDRLEDYAKCLGKFPKEIEGLNKDFTIGVTSFFRDAEAFAALRTKALPEILKEGGERRGVRVWVPGCSTGEEAYSIAVECRDFLNESGRDAELQIFGTDMDATAVNRARAGHFPEAVAKDIPEHYLDRYFTRVQNMLKVNEEIRESIVFAAHNVLRDPPFSNIDLVSCRNLLIYMNAELQDDILRIFHYSLVPGGCLFLGSSETIGRSGELFRAVDRRWKIFRRKQAAVRYVFAPRFPGALEVRGDHGDAAPGTVPSGAMGGDPATERLVTRMKVEFEAVTRKAILEASQEMAWKRPPGGKEAPGETEAGGKVEDLEREIQGLRESYQTAVEEMLSANEELQSTNEELQSTNEELRSSNEELETSREELQSVNEELMAVNAEHQEKIEQLTKVTNDMDNLIASTEIATVFVDMKQRIRKYTPAARKVINLIDTDLGRPLGDLTLRLEVRDVSKDLQSVFDTLVPLEKEVRSVEGGWYAMRVLPYRTREHQVDGAVITFTDIDRIRREGEMRIEASRYAEDIVNTIREPLVVIDTKLRVVSANRSFYAAFGVRTEETLSRSLFDLGGGHWDVPELRRLLEDILPRRTTIEGFEVDFDIPSIGKRKMLLNARKVRRRPLDGEKGEDSILLAFEDVTGRS